MEREKFFQDFNKCLDKDGSVLVYFNDIDYIHCDEIDEIDNNDIIFLCLDNVAISRIRISNIVRVS